jgi:NAD(P)H-dependent FMN reductase
MRCSLILAHPRRDSLCGALFDVYAEGARQAGVECRELILSEMHFDPDVHAVSPEQQPLEPDLQRAQRDMQWAEHLVFGTLVVKLGPSAAIRLSMAAGLAAPVVAAMLALTFILWFCVPPLIVLASATGR